MANANDYPYPLNNKHPYSVKHDSHHETSSKSKSDKSSLNAEELDQSDEISDHS